MLIEAVKIHFSLKCLTHFHVFKKLHGYYEDFMYEKLFLFKEKRHDFSREKSNDGILKLFFVLSISQATCRRITCVQACWAVFVFLPMSSLCRLGKKIKIVVFSAGEVGEAVF